MFHCVSSLFYEASSATRPLILGKGGFGIQLAEWLVAEGWPTPQFLDDNAPDCAGKLRDYADPALLVASRPAFVALGNNALRTELLQKLAAVGYATPVWCSKRAAVSPTAMLGPGTVVLPFAYVGARAQIGNGCILNAGCIVDHNATLGNGVHVAPGGIVKAGAVVPDGSKVESGTVVRSPWEQPADTAQAAPQP